MWIYKNKEIKVLSDFPEGTIGFIYLLKYESGMQYIGRKYLYSTVTLPLLKSGKKRVGSKDYISSIIRPRLKKEVITKESDWKDYEGSSDDIPEYDTITSKTILHCCGDKNCVSYLEEKELFCRDAVISNEYYNKSIQKRHYDNSLNGLIEC